MRRGSSYEHLYALKDKDINMWILYYWASSQKHKALFSSRKKAEEALFWVDGNVEVVEL
jgi:hypothetical protein